MSYSFFLEQQDHILYLCREQSKEKICVDFLDVKFQFRLKTLSKTQPLFKAVGIRKDLKILDATAGLGKDAASFAHMGALVTAVEQDERIFALLEDGLKRAQLTTKIQAVHASSLQYMKSLAMDQKPDVIYLDPMYPEAEKSAKPKKEMIFLRELLLPAKAKDLEELLNVALKTARERVVIKRPHDAAPLIQKPTHCFESKLVRLDMYKI